jgi:hypothetical protein
MSALQRDPRTDPVIVHGPSAGAPRPSVRRSGVADGHADVPASQTLKNAHEQRGLSVQPLTLRLDGITAGDYLAWIHDPEPPALGHDLRDITVRAAPLGDRIDVELVWDREHPPPPRAAAVTAGFPLTPEVFELHSTRVLNV